MSGFFEQYNEEVKKMSKQFQKNLELIQKSKEKITVDADLIEKIEEHYQEQLQIEEINERQFYTDNNGVDYILYKAETEEENIEWNVPTLIKDGRLRITAPIPLMTSEDSIFFARVTVFADPEDFPGIDLNGKMFPKKFLILARGKLKVEYRGMDWKKGDYGVLLKSFLKRMEVEDLEELEFTDYERKFTFNQSQILQVYGKE